MFPQRSAWLVLGTVGLLSACSGGDTNSTNTAAATSSASTIAEATTTTTPAVVDATTTVAELSVELREGGLGYLDFGAQPDEVIEGVSAVLGPPISDTTRDYPTSDGNGFFVTDTFSFTDPSGRSVCWSVGLCTTFGGRDVANQLFTGWSYWDDPTASLSTAYGVTIGTRLENDDERMLQTYLRLCDNGLGGLDGVLPLDENDPVITRRLMSEGIPFTLEGNLLGPVAPPEQLIVVGLYAGHNPNDLASDCGSDRIAR